MNYQDIIRTSCYAAKKLELQVYSVSFWQLLSGFADKVRLNNNAPNKTMAAPEAILKETFAKT